MKKKKNFLKLSERKGIYFDRYRKKWVSFLEVDKYLGHFDTEEEAIRIASLWEKRVKIWQR